MASCKDLTVAGIILTLLAGCASRKTPAPVEVAQWPVCRDGILVLRFLEGDAALAPRFASGLEWPGRAITECPNASFKVIGLPAPSDASLSGRRARSVVLALQAFGISEPSFDPGRAEDQDMPVLQINAAP